MKTNQPSPISSSPLPWASRWLFRQRKFLPIPFLLMMAWVIVTRGHPLRPGSLARAGLDLAAWLLIFGGEALRVWAVGHIGRKSRSSDVHASQLVTGGPYIYVRNPLYLGGVTLTVGLSLLTGSVWILAGCLAYWALVYGPIIAAEERFLLQRFGQAYAAYRNAVPRWWPRWHSWSPAVSSTWRWNELSKEYQTVLAIGCTALLINASLIGSQWWGLQRSQQMVSPGVAPVAASAAGEVAPHTSSGALRPVLPEPTERSVAISRSTPPRLAGWVGRQLPGALSGALAFAGTYLASDPEGTDGEEFHDQLPALAATTLIALAVRSLVCGRAASPAALETRGAVLPWTIDPYVQMDPEDEQFGAVIRIQF